VIRVRAARPGDRRAVRDLCDRIWDDDYVADVFVDWVRDRRGRLWVACIDDKVVGVAKLTLLGDHEAWLHGLRVDPRHRRLGVATALFEHRLRRARRLGARVARLDTSENNAAVRRMASRRGFRVVGRYGYFRRPARSGEPPRRARPAEIAALWRLTRESDGLLHDAYTRRHIARADIARATRDGCCVVADGSSGAAAVAIVAPHRERLGVAFLAGRGRPLVALLRALPAEAKRLRRKRVALAVPATRSRVVRAAGYRRGWPEAQLIFEGRL